MGRNSMLTSILAIGGITFAILQMMRRRPKSTGWRMMVQSFYQMMSQMMRGSNRMTRMIRSRVRV